MQRNTLITLSDNKIGVDINADNKADFYTASVLSATDYYAFGMSMKERSWQSESYRYGFNGKEKDKDIGEEMTDFGARLMNSKIGRWMAVDPLAGKYAGLSPYNFVENQPIWAIDPNGEEKIVISGGEFDGRYKSNFIDPALKQLTDYKKNAGKEQVTWIIANTGGYSETDISNFKTKAQSLGVTVILVNSADEITTYINRKQVKLRGGYRDSDTSLGALDEDRQTVSENRAKDKITGIAIFSHGVVQKGISLGYHTTDEKVKKFEINAQKVSEYNYGAFSGVSCLIDIYACNIGTPTDDVNRGNPNTSLGALIARQTQTSVLAYWGKTDYIDINAGQSFNVRLGRKVSGFGTSQNLPIGGFKNPEPGVTNRPASEKMIFGAKRD